jgi:hypothetical protein
MAHQDRQGDDAGATIDPGSAGPGSTCSSAAAAGRCRCWRCRTLVAGDVPRWSAVFYGLALVCNYPHYMATVHRAYGRDDRGAHRLYRSSRAR